MPVYNFNDISYFENDLEYILNRLSSVYAIKFVQDKIEIMPIVTDTTKSFWASEENTIEFNKHVPNYKSLINDMYAFIENITILKNNKFRYSFFESKYPNFKEFRELNNIIKHQEKRTFEVYFIKIVHINQNLFDLCCNFKYSDKLIVIMYSEFVILFLTIIKDLKLINISKV